MKKYLVVCAAALLLLPCFPLLSQEADEPGPGVEFTVVPRLDVSYEDGGLALGNSSIYSLFEGNIGDNLSFSICNHWASFGMNGNLPGIDPDWEWNWHRLVDWAYLGYDIGNFNISLGRMMLFGGGMEFDLYDWEVHPILASSLWNNFDIYQEAVSLTWGMEEIGTELSLQMATSPFGDPAHPFADKLYSFGAQWRGDYDFVRNIWSVSYMNTGAGWFPLVSLGQTFDFGDGWAYTLDWSNLVFDPMGYAIEGSSLYLEACRTISPAWSVSGRCGIETTWDDSFTGFTIGGFVHWTPIENLRIHAAAGYNNAWGGFNALGGLMYTFSLSSR